MTDKALTIIDEILNDEETFAQLHAMCADIMVNGIGVCYVTHGDDGIEIERKDPAIIWDISLGERTTRKRPISHKGARNGTTQKETRYGRGLGRNT